MWDRTAISHSQKLGLFAGKRHIYNGELGDKHEWCHAVFPDESPVQHIASRCPYTWHRRGTTIARTPLSPSYECSSDGLSTLSLT
ncbi:hypothetical protein CEXT_682161 [Caerostris extrusa]|uniref:Uncharacterized protein n=1 Tax=Caerostris extrusa TaxID=172846 RepID=A0AAV4UFT4_CAEEX|nr:hypothetical protein CEXT_682161 [Caerostris extrusa]